MNPSISWKPPLWLLLLDALGMVLLALGLGAHYAPQSPLAAVLGAFRVPLLALGGLIFAAGAMLAVKLVLQHRRSFR